MQTQMQKNNPSSRQEIDTLSPTESDISEKLRNAESKL